jgi:hypothetical protein
MQYKLAQLNLAPSQRNNSVGEVYIAQPDLNTEGLLGRLFIIIEIHSREASDIKLANLLIAELNKNYYQNDKAIMRERVKSITIEQIFESCLAKTNKTLYDQISARRFELNLNSFNATVGVIHDTNVYFSNLGKNRIFLVYQNKQARDQEPHKIKEITAQSGNEDGHEFNYQKIFSNLVNGRLPIGGYLLFTNEALPEYVGTKVMAEIISTLPPLGAMEQIKMKLEQVNNFISFHGILIKSTMGQLVSEPARPRLKAEASQSIHSLRSTEATTEKLLAPAGLIDFRHWFGQGKNALNFSKSKSSDLLLAGKNVVREKMPARKRQGLRLLADAKARAIEGLVMMLGLGLKSWQTIRGLADKETLQSQPKLLATRTYRWFSSPFVWYGNLSTKNKAVMGAGIICLLIFFGNLELARYRNNQKVVEQRFRETLALIEDKENEIEKNLIPKNFAGAKNLGTEVEALFKQIPEANQGAGEIARLKNRYEELNKKIRQAIEAQTTLIADLTASSQTAGAQNIAFYKNKLYLGDSANKSVYQVALNGQVNSYNKSLEDVNSLSSAAIENNLLYFWSGTDVFIYNLDKLEGKHYPVKDIANTAQVSKIAVYSLGERTYAYLLAPEANQIYRLTYSKSKAEFGNPTDWLKTGATLTGASGFYLDGNGYVTYNDGRIEKFTKGSKVSFGPFGIEPPIRKITAVTSGEKNTYLADPENRRIIVINTAGQFQKQLQNELLADMTAMTVDETNQVIYCLSGQKIYAVSLKDK